MTDERMEYIEATENGQAIVAGLSVGDTVVIKGIAKGVYQGKPREGKFPKAENHQISPERIEVLLTRDEHAKLFPDSTQQEDGTYRTLIDIAWVTAKG